MAIYIVTFSRGSCCDSHSGVAGVFTGDNAKVAAQQFADVRNRHEEWLDTLRICVGKMVEMWEVANPRPLNASDKESDYFTERAAVSKKCADAFGLPDEERWGDSAHYSVTEAPENPSPY